MIGLGVIPKRIRFRWLRLGPNAKWPKGRAGRQLLRKLNKVARACQDPVTITSGQRGPRGQWRAYMDHLRGGTLAAPCCSKHYIHEWQDCLRQCMSNHCRGRAADCMIRGVNIGEDPCARREMARRGLCLPVGSGETWHVEVGDVWRS